MIEDITGLSFISHSEDKAFMKYHGNNSFIDMLLLMLLLWKTHYPTPDQRTAGKSDKEIVIHSYPQLAKQ